MERARPRERVPRVQGAAGLLAPLALAALVGVSALLLLWPHLHLLRLGYEFDRLRAERDSLARENRLLWVEAAALRQMPRVESIARERLGMVSPGRDQVVWVRRAPEPLPPGER